MKLKTLTIRRAASYEHHAGQMTGAVQFEGDTGSITLPLNESICSQIIALCATKMVESTKDLAENMTAEIIEEGASVPLLESPNNEDEVT